MYEGNDEGALRRTEVEMLVMALPAFPRSVQDIRESAAKASASPRQLVEVVARDPVLTSHLLKLVNSSYFGLPRKMNSVKQAVVFIGMNTTTHLSLCVATLGALPSSNEAGLPFAELRRNAVNVAAVARLICQNVKTGSSESEGLFLAGLLHNLGQVALMVHRPLEYRQMLASTETDPRPVEALEREIFGTDRYAVSAMMAWRWEIKPLIVETIRGYANWDGGHRRTEQMEILYTATRLVEYLDGRMLTFELNAATEAVLDMTAGEILAGQRTYEDAILNARVFLDHG
mgnify:CR=1 FL=1